MNRKILIVLLSVMISACSTSSGVAESSPNHFKWYVDEFWEDSRLRSSSNEVYVFADRHCQKYNKRAIFAQRSSEVQLFKYMEYDCIPREQFICSHQLLTSDLQKCADAEQGKNKPNIQQVDTKRMSAAEEKCLDLGFARNTDKFGECILQLSK